MQHANLTRAKLHKANLGSANLHGASVRHAELHEAALSSTIIHDADFSYSQIVNSKLTLLHEASRAIFNFVQFGGTVITDSHLIANSFVSANLAGVKLEDCRMDKSIFIGAKMEDMHFIDSFMQKTKLDGVSLDRSVLDVNLNEASLRLASLQGADLSGASLNSVDATDASFVSCNLLNTDFSMATLNGADFSDAANVASASFSGAHCKGIVFTRTPVDALHSLCA